jgi:hypothetical protein
MQKDTIAYDSLSSRPLPKWLTNQKEGLTIYKPREIVIKNDNSLGVSFAITGLMVLVAVVTLTVYFKRKKRNRQE